MKKELIDMNAVNNYRVSLKSSENKRIVLKNENESDSNKVHQLL